MFHETRKYTAGIILTAGVTGLFISLLVLGSSFVSASYRASGLKGPNVYEVVYSPRSLNISTDMPDNVFVTCGVSDYYPVDTIRLHYSVDFWKTSVFLNASYLFSNITGNYYQFTLPMRDVPTTYLFYIWANNSAGYFSYNNNGGHYYSILLFIEEEQDPGNPPDPNLLRVVQQIYIGIDNATTTRNPKP
nr:hypothetical protein [Candidatus Sigynarchaeota archaeon]